MSLIVKSSTGDFQPVPEGLHQAVLFKIIDCGTHLDQRWQKYQRSLMFFFEIPAVRLEIEGEDKPGIVMQRYTLSLHEKANLRKMLEGWRNKKFTAEEVAQGIDLTKLIGKPCQVQVMHNESSDGRTFANVNSVLPWPDSVPPPEGIENDLFLFDTESWEGFDTLSDKMKQYIGGSLEGKKRGGGAQQEAQQSPSQEFDDDIPF